jgi:hypothetical protein
LSQRDDRSPVRGSFSRNSPLNISRPGFPSALYQLCDLDDLFSDDREHCGRVARQPFDLRFQCGGLQLWLWVASG